MAKILMIRRAFLFVVFLSLAASPALAANWWPFGGKKEEKPVEAPTDNVPIYVKPKGEGKWALDGMLNQSAPQKSVVINGVEIRGLTPAMMGAAYTPKTVEEIKLIALAQNSMQLDMIKKSIAESQARSAEAKKKSDAVLAKMQKRDEEYMAQVRAAEAAGLKPKQGVQPAAATAQQPEAKPKPVIFNQTPTAPSKVFKDFR